MIELVLVGRAGYIVRRKYIEVVFDFARQRRSIQIRTLKGEVDVNTAEV